MVRPMRDGPTGGHVRQKVHGRLSKAFALTAPRRGQRVLLCFGGCMRQMPHSQWPRHPLLVCRGVFATLCRFQPLYISRRALRCSGVSFNSSSSTCWRVLFDGEVSTTG